MYAGRVLGDDLDWFITLADCAHVTEAAAVLGLPQPTVSRRLARLERDVGAPLFDRHGRSVRLNARGRALRERYAAAQRELRRGEAEVRRLTDPATGQVRFDFMHSLGSWLAPRALRHFRERYPGADVRLHQDRGSVLVERVRADESDVALCAPAPSGDDLAWLVVRRQPLALAVPPGHPLARRRRVTLADCADTPQVTTPPGFTTRALLQELAADAGVEPRIAYESAELSTVAGIVGAGLGVAVVPADDPMLQHSGAVMVPLATERRRDIGLVWRPADEATPSVAAFLASAKESLLGDA